MKRVVFLLGLCLAFGGNLCAEIIETKHFREIEKYILPDTLVLLDIDDTLLLPVQTLGTDVWFCSRLEFHKRTKEPASALDKALAEWEAIRHLTAVKIVEEGTHEVIDRLQKKNVIVMGLTTQGLALATRTVMQLKSLSIDLSITAPSKQNCYFINGSQGVLYRDGILFTSGTAKGEALKQLLETLDYLPKQILFINDKKTHLRDVEMCMESHNIMFTGLRYSYGDERVANFNRELADIQWHLSTFEHIMSDAEASLLIDTDWRALREGVLTSFSPHPTHK